MRTKKLPTVCYAILFVVLLPVLIPYAIVASSLARRRLRRAVERIKCPKCESLLGKKSLQLADKKWREHVARLHRQNPGVRFRLLRLVDVVCVSCGASLRFSKTESAFVPTTPIPEIDDAHEH